MEVGAAGALQADVYLATGTPFKASAGSAFVSHSSPFPLPLSAASPLSS